MPAFTHFKESFRGTLDHIFYNQDELEVISLLHVPSLNELRRERAIPNTEYPSDHFRIEAVFQFKSV